MPFVRALSAFSLAALRRLVLAPVVALTLAAALSACAALPPADRDSGPAAAAFAERMQRVEALSEWRFAGRLVLDLPEESWSGQLSWRSDGATQVIDLSGPAGRGGGRLFVSGDGAELVTRDGQRYAAEGPDALLALITGRDLPVDGMAHWVRGVARPHQGFDLRADPSGQPQRLIQDGWEILYGGFEDAGPEAMPVSVELRRGDVHLRLAVQRWLIGR